MKLRKLAAFVLAGALFAAHVTAVSADEVVLDGTVDYELGEQAEGEYGIMLIDEAPVEMPEYAIISGEVLEASVTEEGIVESVLVKTSDETELQLNLSYDNTVMIDADGMPVSFAGLEVGTKIYAVHSMAQTMSLPPQSAALAIVYLGEDEVAPKYMEVKTLVSEEGKTAFESTDGNYLIAYDETTEFITYKTRNIVTAADLKEGSRVFAWYGMSTKSIPEKALSTKILILPEQIVPTETGEEEKEAVIIGAEIGGVAIDFEKYGNILPKVEDGITFIPVRAIAETAGASVTWDGAAGSIVIEKSGVKAELKIGSEKAVVAGSEVTLAAAPKIVDDRTVVGVSVDLQQYGFKFITE